MRLLRNRNRVGAYLMMLGVGTAIAGVFFFLTLFVQDVWGYSALRTGAAFLPVTAAMFVGAIGASALVPRIGARPLLVGGSAVTVGGLYWLSRMTEHGSYAGDLLGAGLVLGIGFGLLIVPLQLLSLTRVGEADSGAAASLLNAGRQVGGAIGLAVLGTVAWTVVADNAHSGSAGAASAASRRTSTRWWSALTVPSWSAPGSPCSFCSPRSPRSGSVGPIWPGADVGGDGHRDRHAKRCLPASCRQARFASCPFAVDRWFAACPEHPVLSTVAAWTGCRT